MYKYPKYTRIQTNQQKSETVEFKHDHTKSVVTRTSKIAKEIDESVTNIYTANMTESKE